MTTVAADIAVSSSATCVWRFEVRPIAGELDPLGQATLKAARELLAGVAHELNNPLSVVVGYSLMLKEKVENPVHRERIDRIGQAAERCARIVKVFLAMARQRPVNPQPLSLNDIVEAAADGAAISVRSKGARIVFDLDATLPLVDADED